VTYAFLTIKNILFKINENTNNKFLSLGTSTILKKIAQETNVMYVVVMDKNNPKICKVSSGILKPLKIDIIYSECPAKM